VVDQATILAWLIQQTCCVKMDYDVHYGHYWI